MRPVPATSVWSRSARICAPLRATFQMRASSSAPWKKPPVLATAPVEVSEVPSAACWMLADLRLERAAQGERAVEGAVEVEAPGARRRVVGRGGVVPDVAGHGRRAADRVVARRAVLLEVGDEHAGGGVDAEEVVHVDVGAASRLSAPPLVISGIALVMPPVPVVTPTPGPVRRNQVSSVNVVTPSAGADPNVT